MPASLERIRASMKVAPTPHNKGLTLTLHVTAYDNGMLQLDEIPINASPDYEQVDGWLGTAEVVLATLNEFRRQVERHHAARENAMSYVTTDPQQGEGTT